jgi:hypothetical protein
VTQTIHILVDDRSKSSAITCPYCDRETTVPNEQFFNGDRSCRVQCSCHNSFVLIIDRRRFQRRRVDFTGAIMAHTSHEKLGTIHIISLSVEGVGFLVTDLALRVGDTYTITFSLNDAAKTDIVDEILICNVNNDMVGARFLASHGYNPDIDYYLMDLNDTDNNE